MSGEQNPNYRFFGVSGGYATPGGSKCFCGGQISTEQIDPKYCWGKTGSADHKLCAYNGGASCGGSGAAILFARTDVWGTCKSYLPIILTASD